MSIRSITQLKKWFRRGMYPTESQFADWMESYWHKEEDRIPMSTVDGLPEAINAKYDATAGKEIEREQERLKADFAAHKIENENAFNGIYEDIEELEATDEAIKADLVGVHQDITGLQSADIVIRADIQALQQTDSEIRQDISNLQASDVQIIEQIGTKATEILNASKTYTSEKIAEVVGGSPEALDTLYELSKALNDDPNFSATVMNQIGNKADAEHTHTAGQVQEDATHRFVTDAEKTAWNEKIPSVHQHAISDIENLQNELDGKVNNVGRLKITKGEEYSAGLTNGVVYALTDDGEHVFGVKNRGFAFETTPDGGKLNKNNIWHSGNLNPDGFMQKDENQTLNGNLTLNTSVGSYMYFDRNGVHRGYVGCGATTNTNVILQNIVGGNTIVVNDDGKNYSNNKEIATVDHTHVGYVTIDTAQTISGAKTFTVAVTGSAGFFDTSDSRLKEHVVPVEPKGKIRLYEFDKQGRHSAGVIAQEVEQLYPWAVKEGEDGYKTVNYNEVLSLKCAELERENEALRSELEERIGKLEQLLQIK